MFGKKAYISLQSIKPLPPFEQHALERCGKRKTSSVCKICVHGQPLLRLALSATEGDTDFIAVSRLHKKLKASPQAVAFNSNMSDSDSPPGRFRKPLPRQQAASFVEHSPSGPAIIKRKVIRETPSPAGPAPTRRNAFFRSRLFEHQAREVRDNGEDRSSASENSSHDDDEDDSCVTHRTHPDASFEAYAAGFSSQVWCLGFKFMGFGGNFTRVQAEGFSIPLHRQRAAENGSTPVADRILNRITEERFWFIIALKICRMIPKP